MKIYVASSWRNSYQPEIVRVLREIGHHEVYDFRNPRDEAAGFAWSDIDPDWRTWPPGQYRQSLTHPLAEAGFASDMDALKWCDAVVAVQPFGRSASLELGWAAGAGKLTILLLADGEPELMVKMCDYICLESSEVLALLVEPPGNSFAQREPELAEAFAAEQAAIDELIQANCGEELQCKSGS